MTDPLLGKVATVPYEWDERVAKGKVGIVLVTRLLNRDARTVEVENVEEFADYRRADVDLLWQRRDGRHGIETWKVEVKTDTYMTGNMAFELMSVIENNTPGCFLVSEADLWYYCFPGFGVAYVLPMPETREWFLYEKPPHEVKETWSTGPGGRVYHSRSAMVPIPAVIMGVSGVRVEMLPLGPYP